MWRTPVALSISNLVLVESGRPLVHGAVAGFPQLRELSKTQSV